MKHFGLAGDRETKARAQIVTRLLDVVCDEDEFPWFVSDEATLYDVCSLDPAEILERVHAAYHVKLSEEELKLPIWTLADRLAGPTPAK